MSEIDETLEQEQHCVVAATGRDGPVAGASPFWWDGAGLWLPGAPASAVVGAWRHDARADAYVAGYPEGRPGVLLSGRARVYGLHDPVGLVTAAPSVGAASGALALKHAPELPAYARDLQRVPTSHWPEGFTLARIVVEEARTAEPPPVPAGLAPALPSVVPPHIRRVLSGRRQAVVASAEGALRLLPAVWSSGLRLHTVDPLSDGAAAAVVMAERVGLVLEGTIEDGQLHAARARWWHGLVTGAAAIPADLAGGIELPD